MNGYSGEGNWGRFKAMAKAGWDTFTGADIRTIYLQIATLQERWAKLTDDRPRLHLNPGALQAAEH